LPFPPSVIGRRAVSPTVKVDGAGVGLGFVIGVGVGIGVGTGVGTGVGVGVDEPPKTYAPILHGPEDGLALPSLSVVNLLNRLTPALMAGDDAFKWKLLVPLTKFGLVFARLLLEVRLVTPPVVKIVVCQL